MNKPYATLDLESETTVVLNEVALDASSSGDQFSLYYSVYQIEAVQGSTIFDIITDSVSGDYPASIGDNAILNHVSHTVGGIPAGEFNNVPYPVVGYRYDTASGTIITGVRIDLGAGATANTSGIVTQSSSTNVTFRTPLSIMPADRIRFFVMNNMIHVRYFDGSSNYYSPISNSLQQY